MVNVVNIQAIRALLHLASKGDIRPAINGVFVDFQADKTIYVATNGHILGVYTESTGMSETGHVFSVIVPYEVVKQLKPNPKSKLGKLIYDPESKSGRIINPAAWQDLGFTPPDLVYPDYTHVIPDKTSGEVAQFDAEYVYAFAKVNKALGAAYPGRFMIDHNGARAALVHLSDEKFLGVLMPLRV